MSPNYFKSRCKLQKSNNIIEYIPPALRRRDRHPYPAKNPVENRKQPRKPEYTIVKDKMEKIP